MRSKRGGTAGKGQTAHPRKAARRRKRKALWNEAAVIHQNMYSGQAYSEFLAGKEIEVMRGDKS